MTGDYDQHVQRLFDEAAELTPSRRAAFLEAHCDDPAVRSEVETLLAHEPAVPAEFLCGPLLVGRGDSDTGQSFQTTVDFPSGRAVDDVLPGHTGRYRIIAKIGEGGFGAVYEAKQEAPLRRRVALKVIKLGMDTREVIRRFEAERQALARMDHPSIAHVYDAGATAEGRPYFVMELVRGLPITRYCDEARLTTRQRLEVFVAVCDGVHHAHQKEVIHRDLKPANILVADVGAVSDRDSSITPGPSRSETAPTAQPKIIDFGIAKAMSEPLSDGTLPTQLGILIGTPEYMSPEQAAGAGDVDTRSDVYSLGAVLYELLTGQTPFAVGRLRGRPLGEVQRILVEEDPARPSTRIRTLSRSGPSVNTIAEQRQTTPAALARILRGDLDFIVATCLARDRAGRYDSAAALARDLEHLLAGRPLERRRHQTAYVVKKTLRRYWAPAAIAAAFVLLITGATFALSVLYARQGWFLAQVKAQRDKAVTAEMLADLRRSQAEYESYVANVAAADAAIAVNDGGAALARLQTVPAELRNWEWHYLIRQADQSVATWQGPQELIAGRVRLSPDGRHVGASFWMEGRDGALRMWPRAAREAVAEFSVSPGPPPPFEFLEDGKQLLFCNRDGAISRFDVTERRETSRRRITTLRLGETAIEFSPDGRILLTAAKGAYYLWDTAADRLLRELTVPEGGWTMVLDFDATGARLAAGLNDGTIILWDVASGRELVQTKAHPGQVHGVAISPDGALLATASEGGALKLWELTEQAAPPESTARSYAPSLRMIRALHDGGQRMGAIAFSPDGKLLAVPSEDKTVRIWSVGDGESRATLLGHTTGVVCTAFSSDGRFVVSGAREGVVKLWDLEKPPAVRALREFPGPLSSIAFTPEGARLVVASATAACVVDLESGRWLHQRPLSASTGRGGMLPGPSASQATSSDDDGNIRIWETISGEEGRVMGVHKSIPVLAGDRSGRVLASADAEAVVLWDWAEGRESRRFVGPGEAVRSLALSHDAARLALGLKSGELVICDARTGERTPVERRHSGAVGSAAFSPDGRNLATGSDDGTVKLWDVARGRVVWSASPQLGDVWCVAFSPDGTRLAVGGRDRSVRIFDRQTGRELLALRGPTGTVMCVAFSPDGQSIAAGSWAREVFVWDSSHAVTSER